MRLKITSKEDKLHGKILLYITNLVLAVTVAVSVILYYNFEHIYLSSIYNSSCDSLHQVSYSATFMTDTAKSLLNQIYFNPDISQILYNINPQQEELNMTLNRLNTYRTTMPFVHSIYLYNGFSDTIYTSMSSRNISEKSAFFDRSIIKILDNISPNNIYTPIARKLPEVSTPSSTELYSDVYTYIFFEPPIINHSIKKAVIINITAEWMRNTINTLDMDPNSTTFIINNKGITMCGNHKEVMLSDISRDKYIQNILYENKSSGYLIREAEGSKSLITYFTDDQLKWTFVRVTPYNSIMIRINSMKKTTFFICLIILIAGFLASFMLSVKMYKPFKVIQNKLLSADIEKRKNLTLQKQSFLKNLLFGKEISSVDAIERNFYSYGIKISRDNKYILILLKINHFSDFCTKYNFEDRNLIKFAIMNIISELCSEKSLFETVDMDDEQIVIIMNKSCETHTESYQAFEILVKTIQTNVNKYLEISFSAIIGPMEGSSITDLNSALGTVNEASQCTIFYGYNCILFLDKLSLLKPEEYSYPVQTDKLLTENFMLGKIEKLKSFYLEIISGTEMYPATILNTTILRLTFSIMLAIDNMEKAGGFSISYNFTSFLSELNKTEFIAEVNQKFFEMFDYIWEKLQERKNNKNNVLIEKVLTYINSNYLDQNISLDSIAEAVSMSPLYLGRQFKKAASKSVSDYINELRLKKAEKLLETTDISINEITLKTGFFNSNYFYILFKKAHGITPTEFRQKFKQH
jgi:two-component system, response regulator YesN